MHAVTEQGPPEHPRRQIYLIGNAHIDPVWLWRWPEGYQEVRSTFQSALDRMDEYPEFIFTMNQIVFLCWVSEQDPDLFEQIRARVAEGRWEIVGGMWVEPDCNLPAGESLVRQTLYSQHYLIREFGRPATVGLNADPFGHNAMLPQILAKSGLDSYLFLRPQGHELALPAGAFWWVAPDGSRVLAARIPNEYGSSGGEITLQVAKSLAQLPTDDRPLVCFYGVGNHGGGPTRANIESIRELSRRDGTPPLAPATARSYFDAAATEQHLEEFTGELQMHAVGCYSAMSQIKRNNRRCENVLRSAEKWATIAAVVTGLPDTAAELGHAWQQVLFNQFHDILPGTSLASAYVDARDTHGEAAAIGARVANRSIQSISRRIHIEAQPGTAALVVFNPHGHPVRETVEFELGGLPAPLELVDDSGNVAPAQQVRAESVMAGWARWAFAVEVPPVGYRLFRLRKAAERMAHPVADTEKADGFALRNDELVAVIDPATGWLSSLVIADNGVDLADRSGRPHAVVLADRTDTWSHGIRSYREITGCFRVRRVDRVADGPVRQAIRVVSEYGSSTMIEEIRLDAGAAHLEVVVTLDWHEHLTALKLRFPTTLEHVTAPHEIPYGHLVRPAAGQEVPSQNWVDVTGVDPGSGRAFGLGLLNDGKYSFDVDRNEIGLMAVRSPAFAWHDPAVLDPDEIAQFQDQGVQRFTYRLLPHSGDWRAARIPAAAAVLNEPLTCQLESPHAGPLPTSHSFASVAVPSPQADEIPGAKPVVGFDDGDGSPGPRVAGAVLMTVVKTPEDGEPAVVIRAYETNGGPCTALIELPFLDRSFSAEFEACEIKTLRIPREPSAPVMSTDLLERPVARSSPPLP